MNKEWQTAQSWELDWHSNCINSLNEELKQLVYAEKMGLKRKPTPKTPYEFDLEDKVILDIGGGAYSLLLKCINIGYGSAVTDPLMNKYPDWVKNRYDTLKITTMSESGESIYDALMAVQYRPIIDEIWIYNVLQHTQDPEKIIRNARRLGKIIRIFEWVDTPTNIGHIHTLTEENLNKWLDGQGRVEQVNQWRAVGKCFYGIFLGDSYVASSSKQ